MRSALTGIAVALLVAASGCTKQQTTNPSPLAPRNSPAAASFGQAAEKSWLSKRSQNAPTTLPDSMTKVQKAPEGPKRPPKVETCLLAGQSFLDAAEKTEESPMRVQRLAQARKAFEQALGLDPTNTRAALGLARVCDREGDYLSAEAGYREVLKAYANSQVPQTQAAQVWYDLGMCQARQKSWDGAVEALQKAVKLAPGNATYSSHLGWALARSGQYEAALMHFRRTVGPARAHYNLALMMNHLGYENHCRRYLHVALKIDPNLAEARSLLEAVEPAPAQRTAQEQPRREVEAEPEIVPVDFRASPAPPARAKPGKPGKPAPAVPVKTKTTSMKPAVRPRAVEVQPREFPATGLEPELPLPDAAEPPAQKLEKDEEGNSAESILESHDAPREEDDQEEDGEDE